ncbi:MAG TPA: hypothetical protein VLW54_14605 [Candidatus Acidoferrales bacterium]|nr:hypothetical protein [Candidatus Acidoferrales bacterium]
MAARKIQVGQVWKKDGTGEEFLVTKVYSEALATFAMLSKAGESEGSDNRVKVRVERGADGQTLPGFVFAQEEMGG